MHVDLTDEHDAAMWVDLYEPQTEVSFVISVFCTNAVPQEDLVVHKKKVEQVRMWLQEATSSTAMRKYRVSSQTVSDVCVNAWLAEDTRLDRPCRCREDGDVARSCA